MQCWNNVVPIRKKNKKNRTSVVSSFAANSEPTLSYQRTAQSNNEQTVSTFEHCEKLMISQLYPVEFGVNVVVSQVWVASVDSGLMWQLFIPWMQVKVDYTCSTPHASDLVKKRITNWHPFNFCALLIFKQLRVWNFEPRLHWHP